MANTYFKNVNTLEELRKQYKELLKKYHPDNPNGSTEATQAINAEYDKLFQILKDKHESKPNNAADESKWSYEEDTKLRDIINKIIHFTDITIEIIGNWIWVSGNTYQYKNDLKEICFKWANTKKAWYWHSEAYQKKSHKKLSMEEIRNYYGSTEVQTKQRELLPA